jgi:type IV pilus assembly protein PilE
VAFSRATTRPFQHGVTLLELMIVVVIIGILASIAYPSYRNHIIKGNRSAAQSHMMALAAREEQIMLDRRQYLAAANNAAIGATIGLLAVPGEVSRFYQLSVAVDMAATPPSFVITAVPGAATMQAGDGNLTLSSDGSKTGKW